MPESYLSNTWMEAYYDRNIIEVERKALEEEATKDSYLASRMRLHREALMAYELIGREADKESLKGLYGEWKEKKATTRKRSIQFSAAAVIIFMLTAGLYFSNAFVPGEVFSPEAETADGTVEDGGNEVIPEPSALALEYFDSLPLTFQSKGATSRRAQGLYEEENYLGAIPLLETLTKKKSSEEVILALGISYLAENEALEAVRTLIPIATKPANKGQYTQQARWYLALAYYRQGNPIPGSGLMNEISNTEGHFRQTEAIAFFKRLRGKPSEKQ